MRPRISTPIALRSSDSWADMAPAGIPVSHNATSVTVTAAGTSHTMGSWTQLVASTAADIGFMSIYPSAVAANGVNTAAIMEIGVGGSGSEVTLFAFACGGTGTPPCVPVFVPKGSRISARLQCNTASRSASVFWQFYPVRLELVPAARVASLGLNYATSRAVAFGASSAWAQYTSATTEAYRGLCLVTSVATTSISAQIPLFRVGVGASGAEVSIGEFYHQVASTESVTAIGGLPVPVICRHIPEGSRLAVSCSTTGGTLDATLIGIPYA